MATPVLSRDSAEAGVRLSTLSPKYLHTNSTSHTWPFSAVAELIDNAYDPDVNASQLWIDVKKYNKYNYCLVFTDNGAGMGPEKLHKMLSFGFCDKVAKKGHMPVGHYGNGFKSGSMRLGKDAIVFTKNETTKSVGFLSQTYLEAIKAETILVPMVTWDSDGKIIEKSDKDKALQDILKYSIFKFKEELLAEFAGIQNPSGTRIIIFNVRTSPDGKPEFDYSSPDDIRVPEDTDSELSKLRKQERQNHIPESDYSLRAYCAILYLRPRMQIILRGKKVRTSVITKSLSKTEVDYYRPMFREGNSQSQGAQNKAVKITFGFSQNKNHYGIMMYHRNRLVKPYVRVGYQLRANNQGVGVVGVIECDFLQPTHNKQDFDYTKAYRACMSALGSKLNDYWNEKKGVQRVNSKDPIPEPVEVLQLPDQIWVQCDNPECLKWRKMPDGTDPDRLPDKWYCKDHPDINYRSCDVPEEKEEENEQPYVKTQKKRLEKELEDRKRREKEAQVRQAEEAKRLEQQRRELEKKEEELQRLRKTLTQVRNESTIIKSIEENSARQQRAIQQQLKGEPKSPQTLQVKFVPQPSGIKRASQGNVVTSSPQKTPVVLTPNRHQGQPSSIKVVKVFSPATAIKSVTGTKPVVHIVPSTQGSIQTKGGQVIPNVVSVKSIQQGQALQLSQGPTVTSSQPAPPIQVKQSPVGGTVQIQRLVLPSGQKVQLQTPISQASPAGQTIQALYTANKVPIRPNVQQPQTVQVTVTGTVLPTTVVGQPPKIASTISAPVLPAGYKPLESLQEVNRQATQAAVVSPVSAVIPEAGDPIPGTPTELRNQVTVSERYRYIAPSPQQTSMAMKSPTSSAAAAAAAAAIAAAAATVSDSPHVQTNQTVKLSNSSPTQLQVVAAPQSMQVQLKQEPKPAVPVSPLSTNSPSPSGASPSVQISQVHSGVPAVAAASAPVLPVKIKVEKEDSPQVNGLKRKPEDNDEVVEQTPTRKRRRDKEVIVIDSPSPTGDGEKFELSAESEAALQDIDDDLILKLGKLSKEDQWVTMAKSAQQLRNLRSNVCKLLRVLVPEIELGDKAEIFEDATIDDLLKQVLEANLQPETSET